MLISTNTSEWLPQWQQTFVICIRSCSTFPSVITTGLIIPSFLAPRFFFFFLTFRKTAQNNRTERGGFCFGTSVSSPHSFSFSSFPSVELWCDYYTFSGGFNHGPVGPSPRGGPDFNARVLLFPPVYCFAFYSARQSHWHQGALRITRLRQSDPWTLNQPPYTGIGSRSENELALIDKSYDV